VAGGILASETLTVSETSAQSGLTPTNSVIVSIASTEISAVAFDYSSSDPTASATTSAVVLPGERIWIDAIPGNKVAGITAG